MLTGVHSSAQFLRRVVSSINAQEVRVICKLKSGGYRLSRQRLIKTRKRRYLGTFKFRSAAEKHEKESSFQAEVLTSHLQSGATLGGSVAGKTLWLAVSRKAHGYLQRRHLAKLRFALDVVFAAVGAAVLLSIWGELT
ncbi:MAG: hypothetical protein ABIZ36_09400 [Gemmatimonadaceae bacterium]